MRAFDARVTYSSYAMLKLLVSESWMISRRAVAMRSESARVLKDGSTDSFESGAEKNLVGVNAVLGAREAVESRNEVMAVGTDLVR